ncbi:VOC family protein [Phaeobacter italicus]|uniref:VOC family protein n=1 Tax=Phaeobacter italicus TaxID=481446 RepID=UPI001ADA3720|nr:VOC family protein [Phaeobacter italicus]MBO9444010.1 VOC family protein [Phaeobacter italicus]
MPHLLGPDFIGIQTADLEAARAFYEGVVGLTVNEAGPPDAVVFDSEPIPFAVRTPLVDLDAVESRGHGVALWFGCDDADELHDHLVQNDVSIVFPPKDGPFGRYFAFRDPFGYTITAHTAQKQS